MSTHVARHKNYVPCLLSNGKGGKYAICCFDPTYLSDLEVELGQLVVVSLDLIVRQADGLLHLLAAKGVRAQTYESRRRNDNG